MKNVNLIRVVAILTSLFICTYATADINFSVAQGTGYENVNTTAGDDQVGGYTPATGVPTAPATYLDAPYGMFGTVAVFATVDISYSVGTHYIGYFPGGDNCYLTIY